MSQNDSVPFIPVANGYVPAAVGAGGIGQTTCKGASATANGTGVVTLTLTSFPVIAQAGTIGLIVTPHGATTQGIRMDVTLNNGPTAFVNTYRGDTGVAIWVPFSFVFFVIPLTT